MIQQIIYIFNEIIIYISNEIIIYIFNEIIILIQRVIYILEETIILIQRIIHLFKELLLIQRKNNSLHVRRMRINENLLSGLENSKIRNLVQEFSKCFQGLSRKSQIQK